MTRAIRPGAVRIGRALAPAALALLALPAQATAQTFTSKGAFLGAAGTASYTESFTTVPVAKNSVICGGFTQHQITYTGLNGNASCNNVYVYNMAPGPNWASPFSALATIPSVLTSDGNEFIRISFGQATYAVGFDAYLNGLGPLDVRFYNGATLLGSISQGGGSLTAPQSGALVFDGFISSTAITTVEFQAVFGGVKNTGLDDLMVYDQPLSSVPEPSSLALLASGLAGLAVATRRRR
ncbi:MAG: PEP-CTERM sorting domain-containing protein [Gemmatimonadetes bacterium]|nr:PEP-CTERM sorting domain-containing protein [Gemmatimonadota bacterium]